MTGIEDLIISLIEADKVEDFLAYSEAIDFMRDNYDLEEDEALDFVEMHWVVGNPGKFYKFLEEVTL